MNSPPPRTRRASNNVKWDGRTILRTSRVDREPVHSVSGFRYSREPCMSLAPDYRNERRGVNHADHHRCEVAENWVYLSVHYRVKTRMQDAGCNTLGVESRTRKWTRRKLLPHPVPCPLSPPPRVHPPRRAVAQTASSELALEDVKNLSPSDETCRLRKNTRIFDLAARVDPPMNADERRWGLRRSLEPSASISVHLRLSVSSANSVNSVVKAPWPKITTLHPSTIW